MAKKKAVKKRVGEVFCTIDSLVSRVAINFAMGRIGDMPGFEENQEIQTSFVLPRLNVNSCYFHLIPENGDITVSTKMKDLKGSVVRKEVCEAVGFNPFKQTGLLPAKLTKSGMSYSYEDIRELMKVLYQKIGREQLTETMDNLNQYVQFMQKKGDYKKVVNASIHPHVVAMAVVGDKKLQPKQCRLRNIMLHALNKSYTIQKFEESDAWNAWINRFEKDSSEKYLACLVKNNLTELFINPSIADFCIAAEELGEEAVAAHKGNSGRPSKSNYFTEGYQAYKAYCQNVEHFQEALIKSVQ